MSPSNPRVLFIPYKRLDDFYNSFVIALFLHHYQEVHFVEYIGKNEFRGVYGNVEATIYLFNSPKDRNQTNYYVFQGNVRKKDNQHIRLKKSFADAYRKFEDNPYGFIMKNLFEGENLFELIRQQNIFSQDYESLIIDDELLYKYKLSPNSVKKNKYMNDLLSGILTFTDPNEFNDPFDCDCYFPNSIKTFITDLICSSVKEYKKDSEDDDIDKSRIEEMLEDYWNEEIDDEELFNKKVRELIYGLPSLEDPESVCKRIFERLGGVDNIKSAFRVLCMTKNPRDILMWGYYCNGGRGVSVEFKQSRILESLNRLKDKVVIYGDVDYRKVDDLPKFKYVISKKSFALFKYVVECIFSKYDVWIHEHERRFVLLSEELDVYYGVASVRERCFIGVNNTVGKMNKLACPCGDYVQLKKHPSRYEFIDV